jgi:hypothetical protein
MAAVIDKVLGGFNVSLSQLNRNPSMFLYKINGKDKMRYAKHLENVVVAPELVITIYPNNDSVSVRETLKLGEFVEYVNSSGYIQPSIVVGLLKSTLYHGKGDLVLIINLGDVVDSNTEDGSGLAKLPSSNAETLIIPVTAITNKLEVETSEEEEQKEIRDELNVSASQLLNTQVETNKSAFEASLGSDDFGFICTLKDRIYGVDAEGYHTIGSYSSTITSIVKSYHSPEILATSIDNKLLEVDLENSRVKQLAYIRDPNPTKANLKKALKIKGLCYAEGIPSEKDGTDNSQVFCIAKGLSATKGDSLCKLSRNGSLTIRMDLGRHDVVGLAVVPNYQFYNNSNAKDNDMDWYFGNSKNILHFVVWTEKGGLFVIDELSNTLQQFGGDLVQSLKIKAVTFSHDSCELIAAGKTCVYMMQPDGSVTEITKLNALPGVIESITIGPTSLTNPVKNVTNQKKKKKWYERLLKPFNSSGKSDTLENNIEDNQIMSSVLPSEGQSRGEILSPNSSMNSSKRSVNLSPPKVQNFSQFDNITSPPRIPVSKAATTAELDFESTLMNARALLEAANLNTTANSSVPSISKPSPPKPSMYFPEPPPSYLQQKPPVRHVDTIPYSTVPNMLHSIGLNEYIPVFQREELIDINLLADMYTNDIDFKNLLREVS